MEYARAATIESPAPTVLFTSTLSPCAYMVFSLVIKIAHWPPKDTAKIMMPYSSKPFALVIQLP